MTSGLLQITFNVSSVSALVSLRPLDDRVQPLCGRPVIPPTRSHCLGSPSLWLSDERCNDCGAGLRPVQRCATTQLARAAGNRRCVPACQLPYCPPAGVPGGRQRASALLRLCRVPLCPSPSGSKLRGGRLLATRKPAQCAVMLPPCSGPGRSLP